MGGYCRIDLNFPRLHDGSLHTLLVLLAQQLVNEHVLDVARLERWLCEWHLELADTHVVPRDADAETQYAHCSRNDKPEVCCGRTGTGLNDIFLGRHWCRAACNPDSNDRVHIYDQVDADACRQRAGKFI